MAFYIDLLQEQGVLRKTRMREASEINRAEIAMRRCIAEGHTAED